MKRKLRILCVATREIRSTTIDTDESDEMLDFRWADGCDCCDCTRGDLFRRLGDEQPIEMPCGMTAYEVEITNEGEPGPFYAEFE